ncbi:hypothetical protein BDQ12DRAFT_728308 [Crucibulum laeve]|uniref:Uncharacterized protein n=1 Tax=Crucibulum laeve TaxID=68775 RepID=A0A5C3LJ33_9AGAR|nr:hypothetical protein BDQ12DRAFT_728308 [Crucibulum laeve]
MDINQKLKDAKNLVLRAKGLVEWKIKEKEDIEALKDTHRAGQGLKKLSTVKASVTKARTALRNAELGLDNLRKSTEHPTVKGMVSISGEVGGAQPQITGTEDHMDAELSQRSKSTQDDSQNNSISTDIHRTSSEEVLDVKTTASAVLEMQFLKVKRAAVAMTSEMRHLKDNKPTTTPAPESEHPKATKTVTATSNTPEPEHPNTVESASTAALPVTQCLKDYFALSTLKSEHLSDIDIAMATSIEVQCLESQDKGGRKRGINVEKDSYYGVLKQALVLKIGRRKNQEGVQSAAIQRIGEALNKAEKQQGGGY